MASLSEAASGGVRIEWNYDAFAAIRHQFAGVCSELGEKMAEYANRAAESHDTGGRTHGNNSYNSMDFGGPERPRTFVRVADSRGLIDEALHGTLTQALYAVKGQQVGSGTRTMRRGGHRPTGAQRARQGD